MTKPVVPKIGTRVKVSILPSSDAKESVELDYRLLIPGNYSHAEGLGDLKTRQIRRIARKGDFDRALKDINPRLKITVPNKLSGEPASEMEVDLDFKEMKDFHPDQIVNKVEPLKELLEARDKLKQLKLQVMKDIKFRKAIEAVLNEGGNSVQDLISKLEPADEPEKKGAPKG